MTLTTAEQDVSVKLTDLPRPFWRLWGASALSNIGDGIFITALPLLAARLTRHETSIALVTVCLLAPWLLFSLPLGAIVDRYRRTTLMVAADAVRAVVVAAAGVLAWSGDLTIWMLWILAFLLGSCEVLFDNASQALLPTIVSEHHLERANGLKYSADHITNLFVGTPLGGVLLTVAVWLPFGTNALSFLLAIGLVAGIGPRAAIRDRTATTLRADTSEGLRWLWQHRFLRNLAIALGISNLGFQIPAGLFVLYCQDEVGLSERQFGVVVGAMGLGAVIGGQLGPVAVKRLGRRFALFASLALWISTLLVYASIPHVAAILAASIVQTFAIIVWNVTTVSIRQRMVPTELFGRVNSVYRWFGWGSLPIGALIGGLIAPSVGLRGTYVVGACVIAVAAAVLVRHIGPTTLNSDSPAGSTVA
jgi:MFS family permease